MFLPSTVEIGAAITFYSQPHWLSTEIEPVTKFSPAGGNLRKLT